MIIAALGAVMHVAPVYAQNIPNGFYAGASLSALRSNITPSGANTIGGFGNTDCDTTSVIAGLVCDDDDSVVSGSVFVGRDAVLSYGPKSSIRVEAELSFAGDSEFVTPSFPGPPGSPSGCWPKKTLFAKCRLALRQLYVAVGLRL